MFVINKKLMKNIFNMILTCPDMLNIKVISEFSRITRNFTISAAFLWEYLDISPEYEYEAPTIFCSGCSLWWVTLLLSGQNN